MATPSVRGVDMSETAAAEPHCPNCSEPVGPTDRFCEVCGTDLLVHRTPVGGPIGAIGAAGTCVACGSGTIAADGFCERCGRAQPAGRDRMECDLGLVAGVGDRGRHRARNEDSMAFAWVGSGEAPRAVVAVVCDGVASSEDADQASQAAVDASLEVLASAVLDGADLTVANLEAVDAAMAKVSRLARPDFPGTAPSSTYVSAVVTRDAVTVGWVGDSRAYWLSTGGPTPSRRLTTDDTVAAQLVAAGMDEEDAAKVYNAHALSSWIGADAVEVRPHVMTIEPEGPGVVLLCSDGLWNYLPEAEDLAAKLAGDAPPLTTATDLTQLAIELGGHDNVTVVVVPFPLADRSS
jgi:serine/threonine protein phosphatase PrpC